MCVIVYKPENKPIPYDIIAACWKNNQDGAGIIIPGKQPEVIKGIMTLKLLTDCIYTIREACVVHFRFATHGSVTPENTHPFPCGYHRYLMHNGVLSNYGVLGKVGEAGKSDSAHLAQDIRRMKTPAIKRLLSTINGKYALIDQNEVSLHGTFIEHQGFHFSNMTWKPYDVPANNNYYGKRKGYSKKDKEQDEKWASAYTDRYDSRDDDIRDYFEDSSATDGDGLPLEDAQARFQKRIQRMDAIEAAEANLAALADIKEAAKDVSTPLKEEDKQGPRLLPAPANFVPVPTPVNPTIIARNGEEWSSQVRALRAKVRASLATEPKDRDSFEAAKIATPPFDMATVEAFNDDMKH